MATTVGRDSLQSHIDALLTLPSLRRVVLLGDRNATASPSNLLQSYNECLNGGYSVFQHDSLVRRAGKSVKPEDVLTMMFTSGTSVFTRQAASITNRGI
jgi:long-subunit acyl-CoA synthetase (AMP-forming)